MRIRYLGKEITFENANDEYYLTLSAGDTVTMEKVVSKYHLYHDEVPKVQFVLSAKEGAAIIKNSELHVDIVEDPDNPPYLLFTPKIENAKSLYDHYNKTLFYGKCPIVKFIKTNNNKTLGLATLSYVGTKPIYTMHISEKMMTDRVLFTEVLVHEMIHLYHYATGIEKLNKGDTGGYEVIHASHGPLFLQEAARINAHGYKIKVVADAESFKGKSTKAVEALVAYVTNSSDTKYKFGCCVWCDRGLAALEPEFSKQVRLKNPQYAFRIEHIRTDDKRVLAFTRLGNSAKTFTDAMLKPHVLQELKHTPFVSDIIKSTNFDPVASYPLPTEKEVPDLYAKPWPAFLKEMRIRTKNKVPDELLEHRWKQFPLRSVNKQMEELISILVSGVFTGGLHHEVVMKELVELHASYQGRFTDAQFKTALRAFTEKYDPSNLLKPYIEQSGIKL